MKRTIKTNNEYSQYVDTPLIPSDVNAYIISWNIGKYAAGSSLKITAKRSDGAVIEDACIVDDNGIANYTLKNNMYAVEGELVLRLTIVQDDEILTNKELIFVVTNSWNCQTIEGDDRVPALSTLIIEVNNIKRETENKQNELNDIVENVLQHEAQAKKYSEAAQDWANDAHNALGKTNYIGENGNWFAWNSEENAFYDTGVRAQSGSVVHYGDTPPDEADVWVMPGGEIDNPVFYKDLPDILKGYAYDENYVHTDNNFTNEHVNTISTFKQDLETTTSIAKGANQAISFKNYQAFFVFCNGETDSETLYNVGQNIMIETLEVPDLWISSNSESFEYYGYQSDDAVIEELKTNGSVHVGYYLVSQLETQKVDLTGYPTTEEMNEVITASRPNEYELIKTIEITEDTPTVDEDGKKIPISFDLDDNGNTFKLDAIYMFINCPETPTYESYWRADANTYPNPLFYKKPSSGQYFRLHTERLKEKLWLTLSGNKFYTSTNGVTLEGGYQLTGIDYITALYFEIPQAPIGTKVVVYGRRVKE